MSDAPSDDLIARYIAGELDASQAAPVEASLSATPEGRTALDDICRVVRGEDYGVLPPISESLPRFLHRVERHRASNDTVIRDRRAAKPWARGAVSAVIAVLVVMIVGVSAYVMHSSANAPDRHLTSAVYTTRSGQRSTIRLADGSTMVLAPATTAVTTKTGIDVSGEVYFTVSSRASRSFIVRTRTAVVGVLGTQFAVRQYPGEATSRVVVEDGKVSLSARTARDASIPPKVLSSRMVAMVTDSGISVMPDVSTREYTSWRHGLLVFDWVPLRSISTDLSRAYDADIRIADTILAGRKMRLDVSVSEQTLSQVLDVICQVAEAHYVRDGRSIVLVPGQKGAVVPSGVPRQKGSPQPEKQYGK